MSEITLEQYKELRARNILAEPPFLVINKTSPQGSISFEVVGDNLKSKTVTLPASYASVDLTHVASVDALLSSSSLKALLDKNMVAIVNADQIVPPVKAIDQPTVDAVNAGGTVISGTTVPNATVIVMQGTNTWRGASDPSGRFSIPISGLVEGDYTIMISAEGYQTQGFTFTAGPVVEQAYPAVTDIQGEYRGTHVTGTTVPDADVSATFGGKSYDATANSNGAFDITTDPLPFEPVTLTFAAEGYTTHEQTFTPAAIEMTGLSVSKPEFFDTEITGSSVAGEEDLVVMVAPDGQQEVQAEVATDGTYKATIQPLKGSVKVYANAPGYRQSEVTAQPDRGTLGNVTVESVSETSTELRGSVAGINSAAGATVEVVTEAGQTNGVVNADGSFVVPNVNFSKGTTGTVTVKSDFYQDKTTKFDILKDFSTFTIDRAVEGNPVTGTTEPSANIVLTQSNNTASGTSNTDGQYAIDFPEVVSGELQVDLSKPGFAPEQIEVRVEVETRLVLNPVAVDAASITGQGTPNADVTFTQGANTATGKVGTDGQLDLPLTSNVVAGEYTVTASLSGYETKTLTETVSA
ncbi:putative LPXTG cell wall anchor protein [Erwinia phage pEa_SNUABM_5]|uniref:Putative LPXTG cell wall anchor protein n=1 Tax=Erwinia phage pEa_SNUABM_5 TaxID=2797313 RepID=A0A7T8EPM0_9CAUD|nr:putative LPXTG cell wall anchor protein [Erwinia phage pEa_SNUABM_5]QQO90373.1 putative LPXTG cell wall anchor protein [Erwinia phage pEa_SNUABM_5]